MENVLVADSIKLGFGLMRLPKVEDYQTIDIEQTKRIRFVASLSNSMMVLSVMSDMDHMADNISHILHILSFCDEKQLMLEQTCITSRFIRKGT